jgi:hypothetical protein
MAFGWVGGFVQGERPVVLPGVARPAPCRGRLIKSTRDQVALGFFEIQPIRPSGARASSIS